ncbi:MAG TPA: hypothetical protein ENI23_16620, partial [bacterium]|nr:hypothetical protein [bacterium]
MHFVFIPYGKRSEVETLLRDMEAQKHKMKIWKGKKEKYQWMQGQVRLLPFGVHEYICPKEDADLVMNTLDFDKNQENYLGNVKLALIRKMLKLDKIPDYNKDK